MHTMEQVDHQLEERENENFNQIVNPFELENEIATEFNNLVNDQEEKLDALTPLINGEDTLWGTCDVMQCQYET